MIVDLFKLTADGAIPHAEELGLMVARDCGVSVHVSGEHGQRARHSFTSHSSFFEFVLFLYIRQALRSI